MRHPGLLLTCEHGGNAVPGTYAALFAGRAARRALASHRGFDPGALAVARRLAARFGVDLDYSTTSRLLVDLNRSLGHPSLLSEFSGRLEARARRALIARHYLPYRQTIERRLEASLGASDWVLHVAVHSFVPVLHGERRRADVALLYDPRRPTERAVASAWIAALRRRAPELALRRNYPYRGTSDGLTTALRRRHPDERYAGIELELNQSRLRDPASRNRLADLVADALAATLHSAAKTPRPRAVLRPVAHQESQPKSRAKVRPRARPEPAPRSRARSRR